MDCTEDGVLHRGEGRQTLDAQVARGASCSIMTRTHAVLCVLLILSGSYLPLFGEDVDPIKSEVVRTGLTVACAAAGLVAGTSIGLGFSRDAIDTPLSSTLFLTIPVAAAGAAAGALAGGWVANVVLGHQPSALFSIVEGAGLGLVAGAFVGAVVFPLTIAIGMPTLEVPEGYWGSPPLGIPAMSVVAGGFWGGFFGMVAGALVLPLLALYMGF